MWLYVCGTSHAAKAPQVSKCSLCLKSRYESKKDVITKTYNSGDSPVVTHLTTSPPVRCLNRAERTGSLVFNVLWSYVKKVVVDANYIVVDKACVEVVCRWQSQYVACVFLTPRFSFLISTVPNLHVRIIMYTKSKHQVQIKHRNAHAHAEETLI
jgi:hypothetical protein